MRRSIKSRYDAGQRSDFILSVHYDDDTQKLTMTAFSNLLNHPIPKTESISLIRREFEQKMRDLNNSDDKYTMNDFKALGNHMYSTLFPKEIKSFYEDNMFRKKHSIFIASNESWIPWQLVRPWKLLKPFGPAKVLQIRRSDRFFGEHILSRCCHNKQMPRHVVLSPLKCVNASDPDPAGDRHIPSAEEEVDFLRRLELYGVNVDVRGGSYAGFTGALKRGGFSTFHVIAHAEFNGDHHKCKLHLLDKSVDSTMLEIQCKTFGKGVSLTYFNTCGIAQPDQGFTLNGNIGFIPWFFDAGVDAVLATSFDITDEMAVLFTKTFYLALIEEGKCIGEAVLAARTKLKKAKPRDPTWLSYGLYGEPFASVKKQR